jgi:hypothetical protein
MHGMMGLHLAMHACSWAWPWPWYHCTHTVVTLTTTQGFPPRHAGTDRTATMRRTLQIALTLLSLVALARAQGEHCAGTACSYTSLLLAHFANRWLTRLLICPQIAIITVPKRQTGLASALRLFLAQMAHLGSWASNAQSVGFSSSKTQQRFRSVELARNMAF